MEDVPSDDIELSTAPGYSEAAAEETTESRQDSTEPVDAGDNATLASLANESRPPSISGTTINTENTAVS